MFGGFYDDTRGYIAIGDQLNDKMFQSVLLHEIQHVIQRKEGFERGGSAAEIANNMEEILEKRLGRPINKDFLEPIARAAYEDLYGEVEGRVVQRRFENPEEAKVDPVKTRQKERRDSDIMSDEIKASEIAVDGILKKLEAGDLSLEEIIK